ncbi:MAG: DsbA family protein [Candidatus Nanohalobium sp.]
MVECEFCEKEFDSDRELHIHWGEEHEEELNSHQKEKVKKAKREKKNQSEAKSSKRRSLLLKGLTGVTLLIFVALILPQILAMFKSSPFHLDRQPMIGSQNASVKVVEFGDYRCPYCNRFDQQVFPKVKKNYIDSGKVKYYFVNFPFLGPGSTLGAKAGECVLDNDPGNFWKFHHTMYDNQGSEKTRWLTRALVLDLTSQTTNISDQKMNACLDKSSIQKEVQNDLQIGKGNGVSSTPSIFVNGKMVSSPSYQNVKNAIDKELKK